MNVEADTVFQDDYLATWTESDPTVRRRRIEELWAPDGRLVISSTGATVEGTDAIASHITGVHDELIAGKGLVFRYDQRVASGDCLLLRWSMLAPSGETVGRGVDTVLRDGQGRAQTIHMFMGVE